MEKFCIYGSLLWMGWRSLGDLKRVGQGKDLISVMGIFEDECNDWRIARLALLVAV